MRRFEGSVLLSATDLMRFMGCVHATYLDLEYLNGAEGLTPCEDSEDATLLQARGDAHEKAHLEALKARGLKVLEIERGDLTENANLTRDLLGHGSDVVFQGALLSDNWGGWSDFLEKVERPSNLGSFSYEVTDTKLKRKPHPSHVLQLALYSDLLANIQGAEPEYAHVELGSGERASLRLSEFSAYTRLARKRLENFVASPEQTRPMPCRDCGLCRWRDHCGAQWKDEDSLFEIAGITRSQVIKLEAGGIKTMTELAQQTTPAKGIAKETYEKLQSQARLQHARKSGGPTVEMRPVQVGKGFSILPEPQTGDLFYDIEGDPHYEGGLEYLHGVWCDGQFTTFWAHNHAEEEKALRDLFAFFENHLSRYPAARIYHYAPYEITALRRLTTRYGVGEALRDQWLREGRFVDLYAVVRGAIITSEPSYSIKALEVFYEIERKGEVKTAGGSVVAYEKWRVNGDQALLDEIADYNRIDCVSTEQLRNWLVTLNQGSSVALSTTALTTSDTNEKEDEKLSQIDQLAARLAQSGMDEERQDVLFSLARFHDRELKPAWWAIYDSFDRDENELIDDFDALASLVAVTDIWPIKRSMARTYEYPPQQTKLRPGKKASVQGEDGNIRSVTIEAIDKSQNRITLKIGNANASALRDELNLHPDTPLDTATISAAVMDVVNDQCGPKLYTAIDDLLARNTPRLSGKTGGPILQGEDVVAGVINAVLNMDGTTLPIQGPPGTGKTYVTARAILALLKEGKRVAVASQAHEAIRNVISGCLSAWKGSDFPYTVAHKVSDAGEMDYPTNGPVACPTSNDDPALATSQLVGGTAFFFAREQNVQKFDWLFVDEAGQVSLANLLAMGRIAKNIVLVGDPQQLPMVIQGSHPEPANRSCLEWLLGLHATVPEDAGIFLPVTRRMHPKVCSFISEQIYESRLQSHPATAYQSIKAPGLPPAGSYWVPVQHSGNAQVADPEVEDIKATVKSLLLGTWTASDGNSQPLVEKDIIVVAPYNAQVLALREALPSGVRVGTVDKFQGQEAAVCLVSMTASSADEVPRGLEFLFSRNRINVAVSRARALALVFGSPRLRETKCETIEHMRLVNVLCALPEIELAGANQ
jgi:uncharacterized protein